MSFFKSLSILAVALSISTAKAEDFKTFTGKILGYKVRMRTKADLDSHIIRQFNKNDLLLIIGEENDFWKIEPPAATKAFVFRSYILDGVVEANRVNVRLEPNVNAPIIGQLNQGDHIKGVICEHDHKWLEVSPPKDACFYIAKEFVGYAGPPEYLARMQQRREQVKELLNSAYLLTEAECKKTFDKMNPEEAIVKFEKVIREYPDFEDFAQQAKEGLALLQESYLQKKITYLEDKANVKTESKEHLFPKMNTQTIKHATSEEKRTMTEKMQFWKPVEDSLYLTWSAFNPDKSVDDFYTEQQINGVTLSGVIESYNHSGHSRPGDYILRRKDVPIGYLYSTHINLDKLVGKRVTITAAPRSNNHFAFPAYYVLAIE